MKRNYFYWIMALLLFVLVSCEKEVESDQIVNDDYIRSLPKPGVQYAWYMYATDDNGAIILSNDKYDDPTGFTLHITKIDANGKMVWEKHYPEYKVGYFICVKQDDGGVLLTPDVEDGIMLKIDKDGNVVKNWRIWYRGIDYLRYNSYPLQCSDGNIRMAACAGSMGYNGKSTVYTFDQEGNILDFFPIVDSTFRSGFKLLYLGLYHYEHPNTFYFYGWCFNKSNWQWSDKRKVFIAKQSYDFTRNVTYNKLLVLDTSLSDNSGFSIYQHITRDKKLIIISGVDDLNVEPKVQLTKVNNNLEVEWKKDIKVAGFGTIPEGVTELSDGTYLLYGSCRQVAGMEKPFACRMDKDGNILWTKIFNMKAFGTFSAADSRKDGDLFISGHSTGFGLGNSASDIFSIKTNINGDFH